MLGSFLQLKTKRTLTSQTLQTLALLDLSTLEIACLLHVLSNHV